MLHVHLLVCSQKVIEQCESKISKLKEDLLNTKEALNRALLDKDVLEQERAEVSKCRALTLQSNTQWGHVHGLNIRYKHYLRCKMKFCFKNMLQLW